MINAKSPGLVAAIRTFKISRSPREADFLRRACWPPEQGFLEMELAGLEPATSWVRYRVREPNRGDLSSLGCSKFS